MDLQEGRESQNLEDRRGMSTRKLTIGGAIVGLIVLLVGSYFGIDPQTLNQLVSMGQAGGQVGNQGDNRPPTAEEERSRKFYATILGFTEEVWTEQFQKASRQYKAPHMVLFSDRDHGTSDQRVKWFRLGLQTGYLSKLKEIFEMPYHKL